MRTHTYEVSPNESYVVNHKLVEIANSNILNDFVGLGVLEKAASDYLEAVYEYEKTSDDSNVLEQPRRYLVFRQLSSPNSRLFIFKLTSQKFLTG